MFFTLYCRFIPFRYVKHGFNILLGNYDDPNDPGQVNHFQALSSALASTVGMGNNSGVAVAIHTGGPGALFWMWVSAIVGMSTKFFSCTLSIFFHSRKTTDAKIIPIANSTSIKFRFFSLMKNCFIVNSEITQNNG